jgi:nucleoside-diphosphate-sugar epimerase
VHLSSIASAVDARKVPGLSFDLTLITLRNILELAREAKGQIPHVMTMSSSTVYGDFETDIVDETVRPKPKGIYANTKYMGERLLRTYCESYGMSGTIIRPSALYGERCISGRVSQAFVENALVGKPLLLEGGGSGRLDFTHVSDLVDGMARALAMRPEKGDYTFNLTFGNARTIAELAAIVKAAIPSAVLEERPAALEKPVRGTLSTERAERMLGFKPKLTLEIGYKRYCEWYVEAWEKAKRQAAAG